jgi:hypothetical protein
LTTGIKQEIHNETSSTQNEELRQQPQPLFTPNRSQGCFTVAFTFTQKPGVRDVPRYISSHSRLE